MGMFAPKNIFPCANCSDDAGNLIYPVFDNLIANSTNSSTTLVLNYGVNVIRTATLSNFCAKLPQPTTGKVCTVVNMTSQVVLIYPSNIGGQINNLAINAPFSLIPDGTPYQFICIENPLPGAWSVTAVGATGQYDSGEITVTNFEKNTAGNPAYAWNTINAANNSVNGFRTGFLASTAWGIDSINQPDVVSAGLSYTQPYPNSYVYFKPPGGSYWNGIKKVKVYTNLSATNCGTTFGLTAALGKTFYYAGGATTSANMVGFQFLYVGTYGPYGDANTAIAGPSIPAGTVAANIGDPGTSWGEAIFSGAEGMLGSITYAGIAAPPFPVSSVTYPVNPTVRTVQDGVIAFFIQPRRDLPTFKFRFFIEYY